MAKVLVADDNKSVREACQVHLSREGHLVRVAEGESAAIALVDGEQFDVVVVDLWMERPESGMHVLEHIKRQPALLTEVIILTAYGTMPNLARALELGAYSYVPKNVPDVDEYSVIAAKVAEAAAQKARRGILHDMANVLMGFGAIELFPDQTSLSAEQRAFLTRVKHSVVAAQELCRMATTQLRSGTPQLRELASADLAEQVHALSAGIAQMKGVRLATSVSANLPSVLVHEAMAARILVNLVVNAIDASLPGMTVEIGATECSGNVLFAVKDTGTGMSDEVLAHLWEPGFTTKSRDSGRLGGSGIGLHTAREMARQMNGDIEVDSQAGEGSTFVLRVPVDRDDSTA
ncbi:MAG: hypothetical protein AUJ96_31490 [Armatimonadetes bacterium CG2_30_66_41]|nr:response regulator [Armatimonadota bacterium]OIO92859.1 MAG: hypothetical protein AUJ96_31490 [Armatimonadetes bacterium CG2_30_66_41]NCO92907.1 response regulator [Armatimonadota bacterium]NCP29029.1 response regulator [Armatimonadota bacterium]NCQ26862.1 response regulator [Armatimonadota bacterium]